MKQPFQCNTITVYCSSSNHVDNIYLNTAKEMGRLIAENGYSLVFGGGQLGLMGELSAGALENDGKVIGIILQRFAEMDLADPKVQEMRAVEDMRTRKAIECIKIYQPPEIELKYNLPM